MEFIENIKNLKCQECGYNEFYFQYKQPRCKDEGLSIIIECKICHDKCTIGAQ